MKEQEPALLERLGADERRDVLAATRRRKFRRGEVVFHEGDVGDAVFFVEKGHVAIRATTPLGDTATFTVHGPGDAFGEGALIADDARRSASAVALDAVEARSLHKDDFARLRREHRAVEEFLVAVLNSRVQRLSAHLLEALFVPADKRVLRRVLALCDLYPAQAQLELPVTQEDLASLAGTTRQTANRVLRHAEDEGGLVLARGRVEILDRDLLARRAR